MMTASNPHEHDRRVEVYFDRAAGTFETFYDHQRGRFMQWVDRTFRSDMFERYRLTFEALGPMDDAAVLDIGCGSGPYVLEAARRGSRRVVGLDMAGGMLALAKQRVSRAGLEDRCAFIEGTFPGDAPDEEFDYAIVMGVMDYIADPVGFLTAMR